MLQVPTADGGDGRSAGAAQWDTGSSAPTGDGTGGVEMPTRGLRQLLAEQDTGGARSLDAPLWTLTQALHAMGYGWFHIRLVLVAGVCFMADSIEVLLLSFLQEVLRHEWDLSPLQGTETTTAVAPCRSPCVRRGARVWHLTGVVVLCFAAWLPGATTSLQLRSWLQSCSRAS